MTIQSTLIENILKNCYPELKYYLSKHFREHRCEISDLTAFYKEVKTVIPPLTDNSPDNLKNYYAFMKLSYGQLEDALAYSDEEHFNQILTQIYGETKYILLEL